VCHVNIGVEDEWIRVAFAFAFASADHQRSSGKAALINDIVVRRPDDTTDPISTEDGGTLQRYNQQTGFSVDETASLLKSY
jgi:hypothetical protein